MVRTFIAVPDALRSADVAESFLARITRAPGDKPVTIGLEAVTWICPYGAVLLLGACRHLAMLTNQPVEVTGLIPEVHAYLRRIDFFERASGTAYTSVSFDQNQDFARSPRSSNVLELVTVESSRDVYVVSERARAILASWLHDARHDIDRIISLLAEACSNVADHSEDVGLVTVQKYERAGCVDVELAIADLGIGIRQSLEKAHGPVANSAAGYIERAIGGLSSRQDGRGGQGLGAIQRIATTSGGRLHIRSGTGRVVAYPWGTFSGDDLSSFPGTQVAVTFRSRVASPG